VGGLAVGEPQAVMFETLDATVPHLPSERPHYLMGVGKPDDIVGAVLRGIDMFDCVLPTRSGRNGQAFTWDGPLNLKNARHAEDPAPLDPECRCPACRQFSRAYLYHVVKANEIIASMLLTWHNLTFFQDLMGGLRLAITGGDTQVFAASILSRYRREGGA
jgi:queuine tRNA-ribosyltransferase